MNEQREREDDARQATSREELERQIMHASVPKNEREWWASHEIATLRKERDEAVRESARRRERIERLRGLSKSLLSMLVDRDIDPAERDRLHDMIGDMEPPAALQEGNATAEGRG